MVCSQWEGGKRIIEQKRDPSELDSFNTDKWLCWNAEQYERDYFSNKNAGIMDLYLEENETPFLSPTMLKNQFQLLKAKQQRWRKNLSMTMHQETIFFVQNTKHVEDCKIRGLLNLTVEKLRTSVYQM